MLISILSFIVGIVLVLFGADKLTDGASALARRMNISEFVIGLTIVAIGTSLPELVVSVGAALSGNSGISLGNIIGSNIFNAMFILGFTAIITPVTFNGKMLTRELPFNMFASILLILLSGSMLVGGAPGEYLTRLDGAIMLFFCVLFIIYTFGIKNDTEDEPAPRVITVKRAILFIVLGLLCLIFGGKLFVNGAAEIARALGLSEALIGITIVSVGSSLPELAVSVNAARKGNVSIALGNVLGSNILNIFFILGCSTLIAPVSLDGFSPVDFYTLLASSVFIYLCGMFIGKNVFTRFEGFLLVAGYLGYMTYLVITA